MLTRQRKDTTVAMEPLFKCEYNVEKSMWMKWAKESWFKGRQLGLMIMWTVLMIGCLIVVFALRNPLYIFFALFAAYRAFFRWMLLGSRTYSILAKDAGENWLREICFTEEDIKIIDVKNTVCLEYSNIDDIQEDDGYIRIRFKNNKVVRLYADKFTVGSWPECRELIKGRTN